MTASRGEIPGEDLILKGIQDLSDGKFSNESYLVLIGLPRLRRLGMRIPDQKNLPDSPELALYTHLKKTNSKSAHSRYNALIRRLVSFERAMEKRQP